MVYYVSTCDYLWLSHSRCVCVCVCLCRVRLLLWIKSITSTINVGKWIIPTNRYHLRRFLDLNGKLADTVALKSRRFPFRILRVQLVFTLQRDILAFIKLLFHNLNECRCRCTWLRSFSSTSRGAVQWLRCCVCLSSFQHLNPRI